METVATAAAVPAIAVSVKVVVGYVSGGGQRLTFRQGDSVASTGFTNCNPYYTPQEMEVALGATQNIDYKTTGGSADIYVVAYKLGTL